MKKPLIYFIVVTIGALGYAFTQPSFFLGFIDGVGAFAIVSILVSGFIFLDRFGYFDVFGYTFSKTYFVMTNQYRGFEPERKETYASMYNYMKEKASKRKPGSNWFYLCTLILLGIALALSFYYMSL